MSGEPGTGRGTIRRIPDPLLREIAAGEVVTAPADALRELIDNALDAGATRLEVALEGGGRDRIELRDNGAGIAEEVAALAVEPHHTSKLERLDAIATLGFRGEGLYALRQAGRLELVTRPAGQLGGVRLTADGDAVACERVPAPPGTRVALGELFARLPARRAALGAASAEARVCEALLGRYLLHHPRVAVTLDVDGERRWSWPGGSALDAARFLWGPVVGNRLLPLGEGSEGNETTEKDDIVVRGVVARPELARGRRDRLELAVNGRPVAWPPALLAALRGAYRELLPEGRYPVAVVSLRVAPERVLVNVAPDKSRVRLLDAEACAARLRAAVEGALQRHVLAAALPPLSPGIDDPHHDAHGAGAAEAASGAPRAPRHRFPELRQLGRYRDLYLLAEGDGDLWVVDQHAAHERVLFEELERRYRDEPPVELPYPELLELSPEARSRWRAERGAWTARGLELEPFGPPESGRMRVRRVPAFLAGHPEEVAAAVGAAVAGAAPRAGESAEAALERAWRSVLGRFACLPAVKAGHRLSGAEAQTLLDALRGCATPWACPHGRPTALVLSELALARGFGRRGARASDAATTAEGAGRDPVGSGEASG